MKITEKLFKIFLTLQGILFLLLAFHNSVRPIGNLLAYSVILLLFSSPVLLTVSVLQLFSKTGHLTHPQIIVHKTSAIVGIVAGMLGLSLIVMFYLALNSFLESF